MAGPASAGILPDSRVGFADVVLGIDAPELYPERRHAELQGQGVLRVNREFAGCDRHRQQ